MVWSTRPPKNRPSSGKDARELSIGFEPELLKPRNWVDLFRALAGGLAINHACFQAPPEAASWVNSLIFGLKIAVLVTAVVVQSLRRSQGRMTLVAPTFFILGLGCSIIGWKSALFAGVAGVGLTLVLSNPGVFLLAFALLEIGFAAMLGGGSLKTLIMPVVLTLTPVFLSGVMKRRLVQLNMTRKKPM